MSVLVIDRQVVHYEVLGRGRPLIFLHGWVGSWRYWIPVMQAASMAYRAYAVDLWGFGDSAKAPARYDLEQQIQMVDTFLYEMGIGRVVLVGHGLGAVVAMQYALRNPDVVDRVMATSYPFEGTNISPRLCQTPPAELAGWLLGHTPLTEAVLADAPKADPQAILASISGLSAPAYQGVVDRMTTASLLVSGQNDPAVAAPDLDRILALPECMHAINFESSGHFPMLDESTRFNRLLIDFLSLDSGDSPRELQLKEEWKRRVR